MKKLIFIVAAMFAIVLGTAAQSQAVMPHTAPLAQHWYDAPARPADAWIYPGTVHYSFQCTGTNGVVYSGGLDADQQRDAGGQIYLSDSKAAWSTGPSVHGDRLQFKMTNAAGTDALIQDLYAGSALNDVPYFGNHTSSANTSHINLGFPITYQMLVWDNGSVTSYCHSKRDA